MTLIDMNFLQHYLRESSTARIASLSLVFIPFSSMVRQFSWSNLRHSRSSSSNRSARSNTSASSNVTQLHDWHHQHSLVPPLPELQPVPLSGMPTFHCYDEQHAAPSLRMPKLHASGWQNVVIDKPLNCHAGIVFWRTVVIGKPSNCR